MFSSEKPSAARRRKDDDMLNRFDTVLEHDIMCRSTDRNSVSISLDAQRWYAD